MSFDRCPLKCKRCGSDKGVHVIFMGLETILCSKCQKRFKKEMTNIVREAIK